MVMKKQQKGINAIVKARKRHLRGENDFVKYCFDKDLDAVYKANAGSLACTRCHHLLCQLENMYMLRNPLSHNPREGA
jgi:hypothetical protein